MKARLNKKVNKQFYTVIIKEPVQCLVWRHTSFSDTADTNNTNLVTILLTTIYNSILVRLYVCPSVCLSVCPSVRLSVCPSVIQSVCPSVRPSVCLSNCQTVRLFVCSSVPLSLYLPPCPDQGSHCLNLLKHFCSSFLLDTFTLGYSCSNNILFHFRHID